DRLLLRAERLLRSRRLLERATRRDRVTTEQRAELVEVGRDGLALTVEVVDLALGGAALAVRLEDGVRQRLLGVLARLRHDRVGVLAGVRQELLGVLVRLAAHLLRLLDGAHDALLGVGGVRLGLVHHALRLRTGRGLALGLLALSGLAT